MPRTPEDHLNILREVLEWCTEDAANEDGYPTQEMLDNRVEVLRDALEEDTLPLATNFTYTNARGEQFTTTDWYEDKWHRDEEDCRECGGDGCYDCMDEPEDCRFDTCAERDDFYEEQERDHG